MSGPIKCSNLYLFGYKMIYLVLDGMTVLAYADAWKMGY